MTHSEFESMLRTHAGLVHRVAGAYGRTPHDRSDVAQEIVVQLWRSRHRYDPSRPLSTWIYRIAFNVAISWLRREQRHRSRAEPAGDQLWTFAEPTADSPPEHLLALLACIAELDELSRALVLMDLDGNDHRTIGEVLGLTPTNVATKLSRIRRALRKRLHEEPTASPEESKHGTR